MNLSQEILSALLLYGLPVLFVVIFVAAAGLPVPSSLLLIAAGALAEDGQLNYWAVVAVAVTAAVLGDHIGYGVGRWGGRKLVLRMSSWFGGEQQIEQAEVMATRYSGIGIFLSRWLITALGPALNLTSGLARYDLRRFTIYDISGELVWVVSYSLVGRLFSDRIQDLADLLGDIGGFLLGVLLVAGLGWLLRRSLYRGRSAASTAVAVERGVRE
ncbi:MAG: VTT domain-containing protein [Caldilineaceae bacterium]|nr:VTT domain-containing protein [Caldilineaceae bacterium]